MNQLKTINQVKEILPRVKGIEVALLYGSFGRNEATPNSDIDIQVLASPDFDVQVFKRELLNEFEADIRSIREVTMRSKVVVYFKDQPKMEFAICRDQTEIDRNYLGSEIQNIEPTILYEKNPEVSAIQSYLSQLVKEENGKALRSNERQIVDLIDKFVYEFENCSNAHRRSDGYHFYFFYNIALHVAIQLDQLARGIRRFNFLPKYLLASGLSKEEQDVIYQLKGTLFLPEANEKKRKLLDFFYASIQKLASPKLQNEVSEFCESIFKRDFFWNFRDIGKHNSSLQKGRIFRTATLTLFQKEEQFQDLLDVCNIKTIIDLRADRETEEMPYTDLTLSKIKYVHTPFDPWNQPDWFKERHHQGTNEDIAYRFFVLGCKVQIKSALEAILEEKEGSVAIHCFAGKDRTGIFISMLHLLANASPEVIIEDYLASEYDMKIHRLDQTLKLIEEEGGIVEYIKSCGLSENQISDLKMKLLDENQR